MDASGDKVRIYVNSRTFLPVRMEFESPPRGKRWATEDKRFFHNYHEIDGVKIPFTTILNSNGYKGLGGTAFLRSDQRRPVGLPVFLPSKVACQVLEQLLIKSTTVICIRRSGKTALAADGQVTLGETVIKQGARKLRRLYNGQVLAGFAGSTADAFALFTRFEAKLEEFRGNLAQGSRGAGQGMADRPGPAPLAGVAAGGRQGTDVPGERQRRSD